MQSLIVWRTNDATLEDHGKRMEPVFAAVDVDRVKVKTVKISSEALEDCGVAACKAVVESEIRVAAARGVSPRDMFIEVRTGHPCFRLQKAG